MDVKTYRIRCIQLYYNALYGFIILLKPGCYDNVYSIPGAIQQFIIKCVAGGRVMTNSNKQHHVKKKIADFGACSLYPSAMYFMEGF